MQRVLPVLLTLTALAAAGADNLLKNPGFEEKGGWMPYGTIAGMGDTSKIITYSTDQPHAGKFCLAANDTWADARPFATQFADLPADTTRLELRFFARADQARRFRAGLLFNRKADKKFISADVKVFEAGPEWKEYVMEFNRVPADADNPNLMLAPTTDDKAETGTVYFDDVSLKALTPKTENPADKFGLDREPVNQLNYPFTPADGAVLAVNPSPFVFLPPLDWKPGKYTYSLEYSPDPAFKSADTVRQGKLDMHMYIPRQTLKPGKWYWRYGVENAGGAVVWSKSRSFTVPDGIPANPYPDLDAAVKKISKGHPRLYMNPDAVAEIRRRAKSGDLKELADGLKKWMDKHIDAPLIPEPDYLPPAGDPKRLEVYTKIFKSTRPDQQRMNQCALTYLLTGDPKYGNEAKRRLLYFFVDWNPEGATALENNDEPAMWIMRWGVCAYDWTYDLFTPEERAKMEKSILIRAKQNYDFLRRKPMDSNPYESHANGYLQILGEAAIMLLPEHPEMKDYLDYALTVFWVAAPTYGTPDGGWNEGPGYWSYTIDRTMRFLFVVRNATGIDLGKKPFFVNTGYYPMIGWPGPSKQTSFGDGVDPVNQAQMLKVMAAYNRNADFLKPSSTLPSRLDFSVWPVLTGGVKLDKPNLAKLPKAWNFPGIGFVAMRTDLDNFDNDVGLIFQSNPYGTVSHHHNAQNCFMLEAFGEPLAISSGYYDYYSSPHHEGWTRQTKARNGVTFDGGKGQIRGGEAVGKITEFSTGKDFDIATGDATAAYPGFLKAKRTIVHVRPGIFVIRDFNVDKNEHIFEYNLHGFKPGAFDEKAQKVTLKMPKAELEVRFLADKPWKFESFDKFPVAPQPSPSRTEQWHFRASAPEKSREMDLITVLLPYRVGERDKLPEVKKLADGVELTFKDGKKAIVRFDGDKVITEKK